MSTLFLAIKSLLLQLHFVCSFIIYFCYNFWQSTSLHRLKESAQPGEFYVSVFETDRKRLQLRALCLPLDQLASSPPRGAGAAEQSWINLSDKDNTVAQAHASARAPPPYPLTHTHAHTCESTRMHSKNTHTHWNMWGLLLFDGHNAEGRRQLLGDWVRENLWQSFC